MVSTVDFRNIVRHQAQTAFSRIQMSARMGLIHFFLDTAQAWCLKERP
jgi:hypothetical protein